MPLYEIVLRFDDHDEVRLAEDDGYERGAEVTIAHRTYRVVGTEPPQWPNATERFILRPVEE